ncbi:hypothetical protein SARC_15470, partial [Sphaeroforma arctica JP610]
DSGGGIGSPLYSTNVQTSIPVITVSDSEFVGNAANGGGGISANVAHIRRCSFQNNQAALDGNIRSVM